MKIIRAPRLTLVVRNDITGVFIKLPISIDQETEYLIKEFLECVDPVKKTLKIENASAYLLGSLSGGNPVSAWLKVGKEDINFSS